MRHRTIFPIFALTLAWLAPYAAWAATIQVNNVADVTANDGKCALREAITAANKNEPSGLAHGECRQGDASGDTIELAAGTYALLKGSLNIDSDVFLHGAGANVTKIDAGGLDRVLSVSAVNADTRVEISGVTITGGKTDQGGGGVYNQGNALKLTGVVIAWNTARWGGGIENRKTIVLSNSVLANNKAANTAGGGIYNSGTLTLSGSSVTNNTAVLDGGGIANDGAAANATITATTVANNATSFSRGGGVYNSAGATLSITNATIASNTAKDSGGGIANAADGGQISVLNSTIALNSTSKSGGGIFNGSTNPVLVTNSVIDKNSAIGLGPDCSEATLTFGGADILGTDAGCTFVTKPGTDFFIGNAGLGSFVDDGLPGHGSFPLLATSPAINKGQACPPTDQLGRARAGACDIGAIEAVCGDGTVQPELGEQCDDGNLADGDGCSGKCAKELAVSVPEPEGVAPPVAPIAAPAGTGEAPAAPVATGSEEVTSSPAAPIAAPTGAGEAPTTPATPGPEDVAPPAAPITVPAKSGGGCGLVPGY